MTGDKKEVLALQKTIEKDFVDGNFRTLIPSNEFERLEEFKKYLTGRLKDLYEHNYEILLNTLYRIDVSEKNLLELFGGKNREDIPSKLADLIIERQLQKIRFRKQYREGKI